MVLSMNHASLDSAFAKESERDSTVLNRNQPYPYNEVTEKTVERKVTSSTPDQLTNKKKAWS